MQSPWQVPVLIVGIFALRGVVGYLASYAMSWVENRVINDIRQQLFERLLHLPTHYFDRNPSASLISKFTYDVSNIASASTSVGTVLIRDSQQGVATAVGTLQEAKHFAHVGNTLRAISIWQSIAFFDVFWKGLRRARRFSRSV
jgi:subfamily B ATP-binding cassette protein MsbA